MQIMGALFMIFVRNQMDNCNNKSDKFIECVGVIDEKGETHPAASLHQA